MWRQLHELVSLHLQPFQHYSTITSPTKARNAPHAAHPWLTALDGLIITSENKSLLASPKVQKCSSYQLWVVELNVLLAARCDWELPHCARCWNKVSRGCEMLFRYRTPAYDAGWSTNGNIAKQGGLMESWCQAILKLFSPPKSFNTHCANSWNASPTMFCFHATETFAVQGILCQCFSSSDQTLSKDTPPLSKCSAFLCAEQLCSNWK